MSKAKGSYYERTLVKAFKEHGLESWRVPLSGALGESDLSTLPDRVKKYLVGDVAVSISGQDVPIEVKFRSDAQGFTHVYRGILSVGATTEFSDKKSSKKVRSISSIRGVQYEDCLMLVGIEAFVWYFSGPLHHPLVQTSNTKLLNTTLTNWLDQCKVLALRSKRSKEWYFILIE